MQTGGVSVIREPIPYLGTVYQQPSAKFYLLPHISLGDKSISECKVDFQCVLLYCRERKLKSGNFCVLSFA